MTSTARRLYGTDEAVEPTRSLHAGPLTMDLRGGKLLRIRCGGHEVWHGLAFVLRDPDWGTPEAQYDRVEVHDRGDAFEATLEGRFVVAPAVRVRLRISGSREGCIRFDAVATPVADLAVNRLGLCLMHPLSACGARVEVGHVDGRTSASTFPTLIPPWPPFMLVRSLRHEWHDGRWATAQLEGDVFETEDQRNNADASFKTYSRSNMAPRPYRLAGGASVVQSATLRIEGGPAPAARPADEAVRVRVGHVAGALAPVGIELHAADTAAPASRLEALRSLRPAHLHLAWRPGLALDWAALARLLDAAGARLRLDASVTDAEADLRALQAALVAARIDVESLAVFPSDARTVGAARRVYGGVALGGGTPHFFVQLSRLDALGPVDFASFTTSSVVHGADDDEVMLGLASLPGMVATWRARHPALPLRVGPSAIAARASPLGAQPPSDGTRRLALAATDPRTRAQFGAAWALGHVAALAQAGVQAMSLLSLTGAAGLGEVRNGVFSPFPAFGVLSSVTAPAERLHTEVSDAQTVAALALGRGGRTQLLLANLRAEPTDVHVAGFGIERRLRLSAYDTVALDRD